MRRVLIPLVLLGSLLAVPTQSTAAVSDQSYIVQFKDGFNPTAQAALAKNLGLAIDFQYTLVLNGFAARMNDSQVAALSRNPNFSNIEKDQVVTVDGDVTRLNATWGLDRIDQASLPLDSKYIFDSSAGSGVTVYVIDTGVRSTHKELSPRVSNQGFTAINDKYKFQDCNGHGTHVSGTIGGLTYGVAERVTIVPVRVLDCRGSGSSSGVIAGMDWVANQVKAKGGTAVANMSLGGGFYQPINDAIARMTTAGVLVAVAAGNSTADACNSSPASAPSALTVGATTSDDVRSSFSNYGTCVDLFAPGSGITSAWNTSDTAINTISGTSMASPHVAGIAALLLGQNTSLTVQQLSSRVISYAVSGALTGIGTGSPNLLAQSRATLTTSIKP